MKYNKKRLITIAKKIERKDKISPKEIDYLLSFEKKTDDASTSSLIKKIAVPLSLAFGFFFTVFPDTFAGVAKSMPDWTNLSPQYLSGVDYLWDIIGEPVGKANILYHIPNIILYSFGVLGIKKLFDALDKKSWLDKVLASRLELQQNIASGTLHLTLQKGCSLLFVGKGDFIGMQLVHNQDPELTVTISEQEPTYTNIWNYYSSDTFYDDLKNVIENSSGQTAGEYIFFPVKDDQIFLPGPTAYDLSPHKLDILCQDIRNIEKEKKWRSKRIIIVGDRYHMSKVVSEDKEKRVKKSEDIISLESIAQKYSKVTLIDPTDIVIQKIIDIAQGRKIVFRATQEGIKEYKKRFYDRLEALGYKEKKNKKGILTIGYDLFEDQTEQQVLSRKIDDYYAVVLSKNIHDALIRNGYKKSDFLYVPELVLEVTAQKANQQ
jgi:hypothetical protein